MILDKSRRVAETASVLLVDDVPANLLALRAILDRPDYRVVEAATGHEALRALMADDFAVVLLDVTLPDINGLELARLIKGTARGRDVPLIFVTAVANDPREIVKGYAAGAADYLTKPLVPAAVQAKVAVFAELHRKTQRLARQADLLRESEARSRTIIEQAHDAFVEIDAEGRITGWNAQAERTLGWTRDEAIGRIFLDTVIPPARRRHYGDLAALVGAKSPQSPGGEHQEIVAAHKDGREIPVELTVTAVALNRRVTFAAFLHDITQRKHLEELRRLASVAEEASRAKSAFLANVSHEIRTPLGAIVGFTELLSDPGVQPAERGQYLETIQRNGHELTRLIDDLLDFSKIEAGHLALEKTRVAPPAIAATVLQTFRPLAERRGLQLGASVDAAAGLELLGDPLRIRQILFNLVGNALKFTAEGCVNLTAAPVEGPEPRLGLRVSDTGIGLSSEEAQRLFQPFAQADASTSRQFGGTGLGLALSRRLARAMGGELILETSAKGRGSTFLLTLPSAPAAAAAAEPVRAGAAAGILPSARRLDGLKILIVDDAADNRRLFSRFLEVAGASVDVADGGDAGVNKASTGEFDVVLMDVEMPGVDGFEATSRLRNLGFSKPIIALTAHAMLGYRERCIAAGCTEHISKPVDRSRLVDTIASLTEGLARKGASASQGITVSGGPS